MLAGIRETLSLVEGVCWAYVREIVSECG